MRVVRRLVAQVAHTPPAGVTLEAANIGETPAYASADARKAKNGARRAMVVRMVAVQRQRRLRFAQSRAPGRVHPSTPANSLLTGVLSPLSPITLLKPRELLEGFFRLFPSQRCLSPYPPPGYVTPPARPEAGPCPPLRRSPPNAARAPRRAQRTETGRGARRLHGDDARRPDGGRARSGAQALWSHARRVPRGGVRARSTPRAGSRGRAQRGGPSRQRHADGRARHCSTHPVVRARRHR